ncbi:MAG: phage minor head protein, partial [Patescibacteria group bacterium]|nr:phage minor head protein [Patescibacteria group bacterium]
NEKRDFLKYDPIKNGDEILIPFNLIPYSQEKSKKDGNQDKKKINKDISHPLRDEYIRRKYWKLQIKRSDRREEHFLKAVKKYFNGQKDRIIEKLEPTNMKIFRKKGLADEVFNEKMEIKIGIDKLKPFLETYLIEAGMETIEFIGSEYEFNISGEIISWLDKKTEIFLRSVNKTTFKELKKQFEESLANNEDRRKLIRRIKKTYGNINKTRAGTIARTEVQGITQKGTFEGYKQAMMPIKIWVAVMDSSTRDSHAYLDGEERPIDMPFSNGLMYPGADGPASEVINCRCKI